MRGENDDTVPDLILIFTKGRKEWVEKDDSVQMLPDLLAAFAYLCDPGIKNAAAARGVPLRSWSSVPKPMTGSPTAGWIIIASPHP